VEAEGLGVEIAGDLLGWRAGDFGLAGLHQALDKLLA
jgi:hypothetical protein